MMERDYKEFIQTHKNNFWNNLRLGKKGREWVDKYTDELCPEQAVCSGCPLEQWCGWDDGSWFAWTHPWSIISIHAANWLEAFLWDHWYQKHPCKKVQTCSCCGFKERGSNYYLKTYSGWDYKDHKWICHHCWGHPNDDCDIVNGELVPISHEEYEQSWKEYVKQSNKELEENHYGS